MHSSSETWTKTSKTGTGRITRSFWICDRDNTEMRQVGSAGCVHDDYITYFWQCDKCLLVQTGNPLPSASEIELLEAGWEKEDKLKP